MKGKTSITLPEDLLAAIDGTGLDRSQFIELATRRQLAAVTTAQQEAADAAILEQVADGLNEEAADVLEYQHMPE